MIKAIADSLVPGAGEDEPGDLRPDRLHPRVQGLYVRELIGGQLQPDAADLIAGTDPGQHRRGLAGAQFPAHAAGSQLGEQPGRLSAGSPAQRGPQAYCG